MVNIKYQTDHSIWYQWKHNNNIASWYISYGTIHSRPFTVYRPNIDIHNDFYIIHLPLELNQEYPTASVNRLLKLNLLK